MRDSAEGRQRNFKDWYDAIAKALREGQKRGVVRSDINANETVPFLIAAWEGTWCKGRNSQDSTDDAIRSKIA
jgi:hypothetical protein